MARGVPTVALPLLGAVAIWLSGHDWRSRSHCVMVMSICGATALAAWIAVCVSGQEVLPSTLQSTTSTAVCVSIAFLSVASLDLAGRLVLERRCDGAAPLGRNCAPGLLLIGALAGLSFGATLLTLLVATGLLMDCIHCLNTYHDLAEDMQSNFRAR